MPITLPDPSPRLLLAQFSSIGSTASNLDPDRLDLRATKMTNLLKDILSRNEGERPFPQMPAPARSYPRSDPEIVGHQHGGIND